MWFLENVNIIEKGLNFVMLGRTRGEGCGAGLGLELVLGAGQSLA